MPNPTQMPPQAQKTVKAQMHLITFVSKSSPTPKDTEEFDKRVDNFLKTIDNKKRFMKGSNAYAVSDKLCAQVWYLEALEPEPIIKPLGQKDEPATKEKHIKT